MNELELSALSFQYIRQLNLPELTNDIELRKAFIAGFLIAVKLKVEEVRFEPEE